MQLANVAVLALALVLVAHAIPWSRATLSARTGPPIAQTRAWGYQLRELRPDAPIPKEIDLLVVDHFRDGGDVGALTAAEVERLRRRTTGSPRIVLSYLSIGEAERSRYYWRGHWRYWRPGWLGRESPRRKDNHPVRYWEPGWQRLILSPERTVLDAVIERLTDGRTPYLDRIIDAGFDGVYLDHVDAFRQWTAERKDAERAMVRLVADISRYAKTRRPGFLVVPQNAEELLRLKSYREAVDGIAREDLLLGRGGDGKPDPAHDIKTALAHLKRARAAGLPVLVVEYLERADQRRQALALADEQGFVMLFAQRALDRPPQLVSREAPSPAPAAHPSRVAPWAPMAPAAPLGPWPSR